MGDFDLRVISLGAGVQSSVLYIRSALEDGLPRVDVAIFADTQAEPPWVYERLDQLERDYGAKVPIRRVSEGSLERNIRWGGEQREGFAQIPAYLANPETGKRGIGRRQCTYQFKIKPIQREIRRLLGLRKGQRAAGRFSVELWKGISLDEAHRAKPAEESWITARYPLLFDTPMRRGDCIEYAKRLGVTDLRKSACFFCPYQRDKQWRVLRSEAPALFEKAVAIDDDLRGGGMKCGENLRSQQYLHDSLKPLRDVDLDTDRDQPDLFGNECEGVCGV